MNDKVIQTILGLSVLVLNMAFLHSCSFIQRDEHIEEKVKNLNVVSMVEDEAIICQTYLSKFYEQNTYTHIWNSSSELNHLIDILEKASEEGLDPNEYHLEKLKYLNSYFRKLHPEKRTNLEILASDACLLYIQHMIYGKINPKTADYNWHYYRPSLPKNPVDILMDYSETGNIEQILKDLAPKHKIYSQLKANLETYEKIKENGGWEPVETGNTIKPLMKDQRIKKVRNRLQVSSDLKKYEPEDSILYDVTLETAVKKFQRRHGLEVDGKIGNHTIDAMNIPVSDRIEQIKVNMERCKWLPQELGTYYVSVNIPDFTLEIVNNNEVISKHRIIVGMKDRQTKLFSSRMTHLVFNSTWTIPPNILKEDIIPMAIKDSNYLSNRNIEIQDFYGNSIDTLGIKWTVKNAGGFNYVQEPGPLNPLGKVKFLLPNNFFIYLHDTPYKYLFDREIRAFSSGCIRVENAINMAEYVLKSNEEWNEERMDKILNPKKGESPQMLYVKLKKQPLVYILYFTSWKDKNGVVQFRRDIYNKDNRVAMFLKQPTPPF